MGKRKNFDGQYPLPFDSPNEAGHDRGTLIGVRENPRVNSLQNKIFRLCSLDTLRNQKQENEALKRILAHSEALDW